MNERIKIERSSGNVFTDLGFSQPEAAHLLLRAQLMSEIRELARGTSQADAASRLGVTQPRLNDLLRGKVENFSLDALVKMLTKAGLRVEMRVTKARGRAAAPPGRKPRAQPSRTRAHSSTTS
jgi:predicted XRE-type DNA-binding protein